MVVGFPEIFDMTISVIGVMQGIFLCLLLRSEGVGAFAANRWMMLFLAAVMVNLLEDIGEVFLNGASKDVLLVFFFPANFLIAPAIYLYFREISGTPSRRPWGHFLLAGLIFNLMLWLLTVGGLDSLEDADAAAGQLSTGYLSILIAGIRVFCWLAILTQSSLYIWLIWRVSRRYFRKTQEQLGADRQAMQRWITVILGGVSLMFVTVLIGKIAGLYLPDRMEMTGVGIAIVLVLFAMSYVIATQPTLFVLPDWPGDMADADSDAIATGTSTPVSNRSSDSLSNSMSGEENTLSDRENPGDMRGNVARPLLDEDGVRAAVARLSAIYKQREILLDPLVSLPKLAKAVGITPNQLSYVLNRHVGQSFFDFVNSARIEEAHAVLLLEPDRTILDIALSVGFNSKSTFNLAFKKITGETPSAVREAARDKYLSNRESNRGNASGTASEAASERPDAQHRTSDAV